MNNDQHLRAFLDSYDSFIHRRFYGRYLNFEMLEPELEQLSDIFRIKKEGNSTREIPIYSVSFGQGPLKILGWSQMHGNESTTTKALFDIFNYLSQNMEAPEVSAILEGCSFKILPMLNPDGAEKYTRVNENEVDLNRDADLLSQAESKVLRSVFGEFKPDYCFNLHDQRTIFGVGDLGKSATLSFLAPAMDEERSISPSRRKAMGIIARMAEELQEYLPERLGRFDDSFNINCTGDRFMAFDVPTILFEAGHFPGDYDREETRKFMAAAILSAVKGILDKSYEEYDQEDYERIPENQKNFFDIILRNALLNGVEVDVAIQYQEKLEENQVIFEPRVQVIDKDLKFFAHRNIECQGLKLSFPGGESPLENDVVEGILLNRDYISFKIE